MKSQYFTYFSSYADYYPFGMKMPGKFGGGNYRYAYQGKFAEKDDETGLLSFEARMYDPRIGRWLIPDPARQHFSLYMAMNNNPILYVDSNGLTDWPAFWSGFMNSGVGAIEFTGGVLGEVPTVGLSTFAVIDGGVRFFAGMHKMYGALLDENTDNFVTNSGSIVGIAFDNLDKIADGNSGNDWDWDTGGKGQKVMTAIADAASIAVGNGAANYNFIKNFAQYEKESRVAIELAITMGKGVFFNTGITIVGTNLDAVRGTATVDINYMNKINSKGL